MSSKRLTSPAVVVWVGVLGAPVAWGLQHLLGLALTQMHCNRAAVLGSGAREGLTIALTAVTAALAATAALASIWVWRETRDAGKEPPESRIHFLAVVGMAVAPLLLLIILMSGLGTILLGECHQG